MNLEFFLAYFDRPRRSGRHWHVKCPAHDDRSPSLSIAEGESGKIIAHCFSGCRTEDIVSVLGLKMSDLFEGDATPDQKRRSIEMTKKRQRLETVSIKKSKVLRKAEALIASAKGIDISKWSNEKLDNAMSVIGDAHNQLFKEDLDNGTI